jgi:hypothetical protein
VAPNRAVCLHGTPEKFEFDAIDMPLVDHLERNRNGIGERHEGDATEREIWDRQCADWYRYVGRSAIRRDRRTLRRVQTGFCAPT